MGSLAFGNGIFFVLLSPLPGVWSSIKLKGQEEGSFTPYPEVISCRPSTDVTFIWNEQSMAFFFWSMECEEGNWEPLVLLSGVKLLIDCAHPQVKVQSWLGSSQLTLGKPRNMQALIWWTLPASQVSALRWFGERSVLLLPAMENKKLLSAWQSGSFHVCNCSGEVEE